jgi:hypothetical protein
MYQPMVLEHLVAQRVNELHADAAEQRLARQCRDGHTQRHAGHLGRHMRRGVLRLCLAVARQNRRWPRPDQPTVLEAQTAAAQTQIACDESNQTPANALALTAGTRRRG